MERLELIEAQQAYAKIILNNFLQGHILGGAPRDWYFGNPAKDIDVFFNTNNFQSWMKCSSLIEMVLPWLEFVSHKSKDNLPENYAVPWLDYVLTYRSKVEPFIEVQFIAYENGVNIYDTFDMSICKIEYSLEGELILSDTFIDCLNNGIILYKEETTQDRLERIGGKYPNLELKQRRVEGLLHIFPAPRFGIAEGGNFNQRWNNFFPEVNPVVMERPRIIHGHRIALDNVIFDEVMPAPIEDLVENRRIDWW